MRAQILRSKTANPMSFMYYKEEEWIPRNRFHIYTFFKRFFSSYYDILGVPKHASYVAIKHKYYELSKKFHPDLHKNDKEAYKKFLKIKEAYEVLSNGIKRKEHDEKIRMSTKMYSCLSESSKKTNYNRLDQEIYKNRENFEYFGGKIYENDFKYQEKSQENLYSNTRFNYEEYYEPYYTYERHRIKRIRKKNEFFDTRRNPCFTKFFCVSTIIMILILLSSFLRFNMNKKSRKHHSFTKPLS
ncbi:hypothetical protein T552_02528 [Pneumocystis carinii B80]|uniref:J domain-containing protein n=1 Tax=Pneumocystis carinii (strain B80) TaxID=1408658 RepID=A0A0W4ZF91_PNEC8|nr:hypothetical protein T552_02528 [Pneumocystis carinii B80]KTW27036.1 hypothetical protein T552_02528 [Pneumocystis carinii B80]